MTLTLAELVRRAIDSVKDPRGGARAVMALALPRTARWEALIAVVIVSVLLAHVTAFLSPGGDMMMAPMLRNPLASTTIQLGLMVIMVFAVFLIGRALGGGGSLDDTILLMAWMQWILVGLQVVQTLALLVIPPLGGLIVLAGMGLFFWLLTNFVAELHGFRSLGRVFMMIMLSMVGLAILMSIVLSMIGVQVVGV